MSTGGKCQCGCDASKHPYTLPRAGTPLGVPGYGVFTSEKFNFVAAGDWARFSVPLNKVVLGAKIISTGHNIRDFIIFKQASPNQVFGTYTFGSTEYGWVLRAKTTAFTALNNV